MSYKPIFKIPEDEISKKVEEKVRIGIDSKIRNEIDEKLKTKVEGVKAEVDEKVAKVEERFKEESEKLKNDFENKYKIEVEARVLSLIKEKEDKDKSDKANRIAKAVDTAKALKGESDSEKDKEKAEKEKIVAEKDILCPDCHKDGKVGHIHRVDPDKTGMVWKCDDKGCGYEAVLVPKSSDYKCVGCGAAIKRPADPKSMDGCPFCGGRKAIRFDWSKLWNVKR